MELGILFRNSIASLAETCAHSADILIYALRYLLVKHHRLLVHSLRYPSTLLSRATQKQVTDCDICSGYKK